MPDAVCVFEEAREPVGVALEELVLVDERLRVEVGLERIDCVPRGD